MPPEWYFILEPLIGMVVGGVVLVGGYKTINHWIERKHERSMAQLQGGLQPAELDRLKAQLEVVEDLAYRLQDVEERLDFAERVLSQQKQPERLPEGK